MAGNSDIRRFEDICYVPGDRFTLNLDIIREEDDPPISVIDPFTVLFEWPSGYDDDEYTTDSTHILLSAITEGESGINLLLTLDGTETEDWPIRIRRGVVRVQRGIGADAYTIVGAYMVPSDLTKNIG